VCAACAVIHLLVQADLDVRQPIAVTVRDAAGDVPALHQAGVDARLGIALGDRDVVRRLYIRLVVPELGEILLREVGVREAYAMGSRRQPAHVVVAVGVGIPMGDAAAPSRTACAVF